MSEVAEQVVQSEAPTLETPAEVAQGGSGNDFFSQLPDDIRQHPSLSPIKDVENLARSYVNAQRLIGADKVPLPVNPTDEDLDNIYSRLGRPETPDLYNIAPDGNVLTEERAAEYADIAHKLRLTPDQASGVLEYYRSVVQNDFTAATTANQNAMEAATNELRQEWGDAFDGKIASAQKVVEQFEASDIMSLRLEDGTTVGNHPEVIRAFARIADFRQSATSEDTIAESAASIAMTPAQAQAEIDSIMRSPVYTDRKDIVGRQRAIDRVSELMGMIHG